MNKFTAILVIFLGTLSFDSSAAEEARDPRAELNAYVLELARENDALRNGEEIKELRRQRDDYNFQRKCLFGLCVVGVIAATACKVAPLFVSPTPKYT